MFLPLSTYRIQFHKEFTFRHLSDILDYLAELGIDTIYAAPILKADPGSMHGYDVTDPHQINPEIGTLEEFRDLSKKLKEYGMKWIQDIVPNHMAFSIHNSRMMDVLERGVNSPFHNYFDIDWDHPFGGGNKLMVPFLGKELDECIKDGEIKIEMDQSGCWINYFDTKYPCSQESVAFLLQVSDTDLNSDTLKEISHRPPEEYSTAREKFFAEFVQKNEKEIIGVLERSNEDPELLKSFLDQQWYRLVYWKTTERQINFRRFFTVNSLICLRMEDEKVFEDYHQFIFKLYEEGLIQGVRIDHIDGLNDPATYLKRLRQKLGKDCYIIAEKILEASEEVPESWPLEGTSGYEYLYYINQLFTNRRGTGKLVDFYHSMLPGMPSYEELVMLNKRLILSAHMAGELENIVNYLFSLDLQNGFSRDRMREAISSFMLSLPVYRVYPGTLPLRGSDLEFLEEAVAKAKTLSPDFHQEIDYLASLCTSEANTDTEKVIRFFRRFMQFTGPLTAKGVEDTTFYIYNPLISHVEVGDAPSTLGITIQQFHRSMIRRFQMTPHSMNATATHDTKRGEDARIRLNAITDVPELWMNAVNEWIAMNREFKTEVSGTLSPISNDEYFIYQSILGGFPDDDTVREEWIGRLKEYMVKVVREAKVMSDWAAPNEEYENACGTFIENLLGNETPFMKSFRSFFKTLTPLANSYSVAQTVIKLTSPGIPDIYQGCELPDLSYVDPDNRRPVDYKLRREILASVSKTNDPKELAGIFSESNPGNAKMFVTHKLLQLRRELPRVFLDGTYLPLTLSGKGQLAISYARHYENDWCVVVALLGLERKISDEGNDYSDIFISLPANSPKEWINVFTGEVKTIEQNEVALKELVTDFPVAVLRSVRDSAGFDGH